MSTRRIDNLDHVNSRSSQEAAPAPNADHHHDMAERSAASNQKEEPPALVSINYPDPTPLSQIVKDVSLWSGHCFVMEPSINSKLQIFAPRELTPKNAYELFLASLSVVNLRAVHVGAVVKIVPVQLVVVA